MPIDPTWCVTEDEFDVDRNRTQETLFTTGNGYISIRGSLEEGLRDDPQNESYERNVDNISLEAVRPGKSKWGTYMPGFMAPHPRLGYQMINLPWFSDLKVADGAERLDMEQCDIPSFIRWLDMSDASLNRFVEWKTANAAILRLTFKRFAAMKHRHIVVQTLKIECLTGEANLTISGGIDSDVRTNGFDHFVRTEKGIEDDIIRMTVETNGGDEIYIASKLIAGQAIRDHEEHQHNVESRVAFTLQAGETHEIARITAVFTSRDLDGEHNIADAVELTGSDALSIEGITKAHRQAWKSIWDDADILIEGDIESQLAMRFAMYHLVRAFPEGDYRTGINSRIASGDLYCGHVFWDNEMFMVPFYLYNFPGLARDILKYRYQTLDGARSKARRYGYPGAMYAWQSAVDGEENCVAWQYPDLQIHNTADVVYGIWHYFAATKDESIIAEFGAEIFWEAARFFASRADKRSGEEHYSILGVMGPDEYTHFSHNNAYTNRLAKFALEKAVWAAEFLQKNDPTRYDEVSALIDLRDEELEQFKLIGESLRIPVDESRGLVLQSEDFEKLAPVDLDEIWSDRTKPFGLHISQERKYRSQVLKQADVLMLMHVFPNEFTQDELRTAFRLLRAEDLPRLLTLLPHP